MLRANKKPPTPRHAEGGPHMGRSPRRFDTSALSRSVGVVRFRVTASPEDGGTVSVPGPGEGGSLAYYVTPDMPSVAVPPVPFGTVTAGQTVLSLPWGTGLARAGFGP